MTKNRRRKAEIRAHQATTGTAFLQARRETERPTLAAVMEQHPLLGDHGLGVFLGSRKPRDQHLAELADQRKILAGEEADVALTVAWLLDNVEPIKTPKVNSYGMKHVMERHTGKYVTNGVFTAAALIAGYPHKYPESGPNMLFGMSARSVNGLERAYRVTS